jgi:glycerate 2-kinase
VTPAEKLADIYAAALVAVDPYRAVRRVMALDGETLRVGEASYCLADFTRVILVGAGKATARMALAVEEILGERVSVGLVVVKYGHMAQLARVELIEAAHPLPDQAGVDGTRRILDMLHAADARTLVICLLSGGASALLVAPAAGLTLADKQETTALLLKAGAPIADLNTLRKHLSAVKGGRLAQAAFPASVVTLVLSDVIGDRLDVIASGPTTADAGTFADAWAVIAKYGLQEKIPLRVAQYLQRGMAGEVAETLKDAGTLPLRHVIVGSIRQALAAGQESARQLGCATRVVSADLRGEARVAARWLAQIAVAVQAELAAGEFLCLLCGGETTVTVTGNGLGGRNQELALAFALEIAGRRGITLLSAGTDGNDGPTDAAGAFADGGLADRARELGLDPAAFLAANDSYGFFQRYDALSGESRHFKSGPSGTNVMDIQLVLLEPPTGNGMT